MVKFNQIQSHWIVLVKVYSSFCIEANQSFIVLKTGFVSDAMIQVSTIGISAWYAVRGFSEPPVFSRHVGDLSLTNK